MADSIPDEFIEHDPHHVHRQMEDSIRFFQEQVMGRDDFAQMVEREKAISFFKKQFGLEFTIQKNELHGDTKDPVIANALKHNHERSCATMKAFAVLPHFRHHLYLSSDDSGECTTSQAAVRDGGLCVIVHNMWLYGLYGQQCGHVNVYDKKKRCGVFVRSAKLVFADYSIQQGELVQNPDDIIIHYHTKKPMVHDFNGAINLEFDLWHNDWCEGVAIGSQTVLKEDCLAHTVIRMVMTFPRSIWPGMCPPSH